MLPLVYEEVQPIYKIKYYGDNLYRVIKRLHSGNPSLYDDSVPEQEQDRPEGKFASALSRARNTCREYCLCNKWEYFVTLTFDKDKVPDRYDLPGLVKELMQHIQNLNKSGYSIKYVLVPEFHEDGAVHLHGLMSGIPVSPRPDWWPFSANLKKDLFNKTGRVEYYDHCPLFSGRYGFSACDPIRDPIASGFYVSKYINKSMAEKADLVGFHTYYHSRGLLKSVVVGGVFHQLAQLDSACKFQNDFYSFGFFKLSDFSDCVCLCDEVSDMFQSWVISDPLTAEVISIVGGDDDDLYIQEVLDSFKSDGMRCSVACFDP